MRGDGDDGNSGTVWKLILSYDGTDFHGWQVQPGRPTLQGTLAEAIASVTGEQVLPQGSGRTDAGVHAWGQVASFSLRAAIPAENLQRALNRILPAAIRILSAEHAAEDFHARHSAVGKVYQYRIFRGGICSPFMARYVSVCRWPLDLEAMQSAADMILGEHDFTSFAAFDPDRTARLAEKGMQNGAWTLRISQRRPAVIFAASRLRSGLVNLYFPCPVQLGTHADWTAGRFVRATRRRVAGGRFSPIQFAAMDFCITWCATLWERLWR